MAPLNPKSKPMQAPCEPTTRISYGSWAADGGWEITAQAGQTRHPFGNEAGLLSRRVRRAQAPLSAQASRTAQAVIASDW